MGRNKKGNQRTKGNVKPSSSSKAAEMLVQDGKTGFIGFGGLSEAMGNAFGYVPKSIGDEEDELSIDSELRMLMRKMGKKDTITRLKAVQEFSQLCSTKPADDVIKTLSFWPRIYNKLSEDYDHRVREAVQLAHLEIATKAGRTLAPQLKIIISSWIKSQFDQYAPAASIAKKSFDITFPGDKKNGVISFCRMDLLMNVYDTLIKQTRDTLSDPRVTPEEERETKYNRIVSSTLLSFGCIMELLQKNDIADITEQFENIFGEKKFWKFSKHSSPMIRTAFFTALSSACQYNAEVLRNHAAVLCPTVLCSLDESEPTVVRSFWECLLHTTRTFEECWNHVNARKAVLPKLWSVLRKGGFGSATVVFPNILPFLSNIPISVIGEGIGFAKEFFSNMKKGLFYDSVLSSQAESIAVMKGFMECLHYVLLNFHQDGTRDEVVGSVGKEKDGVLVEYLINEEIGSLVQCSIDIKGYPWNTTFLTGLRDLLIYAEKHSVEKSDKEYVCNQVISLIHSILQNYMVSLLNLEEENYSCLKKQFRNLEEVIKIVLFKMECPRQRQKRQVEFARNDGNSDTNTEDQSKMATNENYNQSSDSRTYSLFDCTKAFLTAVSSNCIKLLFQRRNVLYLEFLSDIVSCVNNNVDFQNMVTTILSVRKSLEVDKDIPKFEETTNSHNSIIVNIIQPIMKDYFSTDKSYWLSTDCQDAVIGLFCKMLIFLDETKRLGFLSSITEISTRPYMFSWLVQRVLSTIDLNTSLSWFKTCDIWSQLITFTSDQCSGPVSSIEEKNIFNSVFRCTEACLFFDNGSLYSEAIADKLFKIFKNQLASQISEDTRMISERILALLAKFYCHANAADMITNGSIELLITIFQMMCKIDDKEFLEQANFTLKCGFTLLLKSSSINHKTELGNVLQKIAYWSQKVYSRTNIEEVQTIAFCCGQVVSLFSSDELEDAHSNYNERFLFQLTHSLEKYLQYTEFSSHTNLLDAVLLGTLSVNSLPRENVPCQMISCSELNNALFVIKLISSLKDFERDRGIVVNALLDTICVLCLVTKNGFAEGDSDMLNQVETVETSVMEVLSMENIPSEYLLRSALNRALERGGLSTLALKKLFTIVPESIISKFPISDLLGQAISHGQNDSASLDALKVILSHVEDLSITRALVEQYVDQLCNEDSQTVESFNFALELCISALIRWQSMLDKCCDSSDDLDNVIRNILTHLIAWRDNTQDALLFSVDLADATDGQLALNVNLMKLISFSLDCGGGSKLGSDHWDFILCSLASWIETCEENISTLTASYRKVVFTYWACNLCTSVSMTIHRTIGDGIVALIHNTISLKCNTPWTISDDWKHKLSNQISGNLVTEWQEFFSPAVFKSIYSLYKSLLDSPMDIANIEEGKSTMVSHLLKSICCSLKIMPSTLLLDIMMGNRTFEEQLQQGQVPSGSTNSGREYDGSQIEMIQNAYFHFIDHLNSKVLCLQILAHAFLYKLMTVSYSVALSLTTESIEGDECDVIRSFPDKLMNVLEASQDQILSYLDENSAGFGSYIQQPPSKDISRCILAFLLSWQINLRQFHDSEAGCRAAFANFIRKRNLTGPMMKILFSILPYDKGNLLNADPVVVDGDWLSLRHIHQLSFHLYLFALECIPAVIRSWCNNNLDKKSSIITERFTTAFASPILCSREIDQVSNSSKTFTNMSIKTRPSAREVLATYSVEEISMELVVKMSPSHPLGPVTVECGKRVGVSSAQWRQWMLQLTMYLTQQNGAIVDGLALWKRNVDKKFEGVEECMICFSVVHGTNYQLPTIICRVCKKRFHSACLYKWFSTSNKSTCPLCRTSF